jgi:hypothetical protein
VPSLDLKPIPRVGKTKNRVHLAEIFLRKLVKTNKN